MKIGGEKHQQIVGGDSEKAAESPHQDKRAPGRAVEDAIEETSDHPFCLILPARRGRDATVSLCYEDASFTIAI
jgi:hypothetical protein